MNLERPAAAWRRLFVVAWLLWLPACGGGAADAPSAGNDDYAQRAAAQLEVEALPGTGGGPYAGRELDLPLVPPDFVLADTAGEPFDFARNTRRTGSAGQKLQAPTSSGSPARPTRSTPRCKRSGCRRPRSRTPTSSPHSILRTCWPTPPITGRA